MLAFAIGPGLKKHDTIEPKDEPPRGILHHRALLKLPEYGRFWPSEDLAPFIEHFWTVAWDLADPEVHEVLPHPSVYLVIEQNNSRVAGVPRGRFVRRLEGRGRVLGTKFRPGGFRGFWQGSIAELTGNTWTLDHTFGAGSKGLEERALRESDPRKAFEIVQDFLRAHAITSGREERLAAELAGDIARQIATDRTITRVEQLAERFNLSMRKLQRLFADNVGVSPKWVIQRYRLHEAAERIAADVHLDGATLAFELGYADQAHFIRDFRRLVGKTPAEYSRAFRR